ncbi:AraC family transcriptional regulator [Luteimonas aquatica]|uniref:AraC family transcriptional regulator n=1 Tax=Luteimonas aquatica TaxID=450364 RepID=UPI001F5AC174|nr:AraC family transcriptional regulator [Luteimonas aquatica]
MPTSTAIRRSHDAATPDAGRRRPALRNSLPAAYLRTMLDVAAERGIRVDQALAGGRLTLEMLDRPDMRVTAREASDVLRKVVALGGGGIGFGIEFGLRSMPTAHGYLGYAAMSARDMGEAIGLMLRYEHLRQRDVSLSLQFEGEQAILEAHETHGLGLWRQLFHEAILVSFYRMLGFLVGEAQPRCELRFDWPEPAYFAQYRMRLPEVRFSMPATQIRFPRHYLERRLITADRSAAQHALQQIEREAALSSAPSLALLERVRAKIRLGERGSYPPLAEVASQMYMSSRTLKRRLSELGTGFQELLDEARRRDAMRMLADPDISIQRVAGALGYRDPPSFTRAFRRWSGITPSDARRQLLGRSPD